jgi:hypothetical protein
MGWGCLQGPCSTLLVSRRSLRDGYRGRSPDLRIVLLTNAFPAVSWPVACPVGFRPRLQWRVREGFAPSSRQSHLYSENSNLFQGNIIWRSKCQVYVWYIREFSPRIGTISSATLRALTVQGKPRGDTQVRTTLTVRASGVAAQRMTSSAWERSVGAIVRPRACAVWRLITSSNVVGCSMGRSPGFAPLRILST